jgi:GAF domain-containing protein
MSSDQALTDDLNTLNQIVETLNRSVDVSSALNGALARLAHLMGVKTCWIFLVNPAAQERWAGRGYELAAHHELPPALSVTNPKAWDKGCDCQNLCEKGELDQAYNEVRCSRLADLDGERAGLAIHASAPLHSGEAVLGVLNVAAPDWNSFTPRTLALLTNIGNQIGIALERARLFDLLRQQRIHEQTALLQLSNQLLSRPDLDALTTFLVDEVRRLLDVDACALLLPDTDPAFLRFAATSGWRTDPAGNHYRIPADDQSGSGRVMRTQQPIWVEDATQTASEPGIPAWLESEDFRGAAIVPLLVEERSTGVLVIDTREPRRFDAAELRFLRLMANQAAIALETARLHQEEIHRQRMDKELAVGRHIQLSMLPSACPVVSRWDLAVAYEAAQQVGGDFYDFIQRPELPGHLGIVIADVSGKGVPAALFMALSRTIIRVAALQGHRPADTLIRTNYFIQENSRADMFLTAFCATLNTDNGLLTYANAGHNRPLWWQADQGRFQELASSGIILGMLVDPAISSSFIRTG